MVTYLHNISVRSSRFCKNLLWPPSRVSLYSRRATDTSDWSEINILTKHSKTRWKCERMPRTTVSSEPQIHPQTVYPTIPYHCRTVWIRPDLSVLHVEVGAGSAFSARQRNCYIYPHQDNICMYSRRQNIISHTILLVIAGIILITQKESVWSIE